MGGPVTAYAVYDSDPDDPVEILHALPEEHHGQFLAEYAAQQIRIFDIVWIGW